MKRITINEAEFLAQDLRQKIGLSLSEPISVKSVLRKMDILTMYRPLSEFSYGISAKSESGRMFMLINSNSTRGRQHFTVAHELYHLYYDEAPVPHMCSQSSSKAERNANLFAQAFLMPRIGLLQMISREEYERRTVELSTVLRMEQLFQVSRMTLLVRLKDIDLIDAERFDELKEIPVKVSAKQFGYDMSLYESGNEGLLIGDFGEKARKLFVEHKISEGHYIELLNMINYGSIESKDIVGC